MSHDPTNLDRLPGRPKKESRLDRFAYWIERKTQSDYSIDQTVIDAEGVFIDDHVGYTVRASRWIGIIGTWRLYSGWGRLIITRQRLRVYDLTDIAILNIEFASQAVARVKVKKIDWNRVQLQVPHNVGEGGFYVKLNRKLVISSRYANDVYQSLVDVHSIGQRGSSNAKQ